MNANSLSWRNGLRVLAWIIPLFLLTISEIPASTVSYTYDDAGRLVKAVYNPDQAIHYTYNAAGSLVQRRIGPEDDPGLPADSNGDGIPDSWYLQYGLDPNDPDIANVDSNGNGFTNREEYLLGTDPTEPDSTFRLLSASLEGEGVTVRWRAVAGRTYRLHYKVSLADAEWQSIPGDITADGSVGSKVDPAGLGQGARYYRISLVVP
jgi:YD repeat-containing protein